jgi:hypothetical protein
MGNYVLRDAITQQVIQTGEDVVLFNINNPLSRTNEHLPRSEFSGGLPYYDNFSELDGFALVRTGKLANCAEVKLDENQLFLNNQDTKPVNIMTTLSYDLDSEKHKRIDIVISKFVMDKLVELYDFNNSDEFRFIRFFFTDIVAEKFQQNNDKKCQNHNLQIAKQDGENSLHSLFLLTYAHHKQKQSDYDEFIEIKDKFPKINNYDEQIELLHRVNQLCDKILNKNLILMSFSNFIVSKNDDIVNLFKSQATCESSALSVSERVVQLFQYFISFVTYKLDNFIIFLPNQYHGEETNENLAGNDFCYLVSEHNAHIKKKYDELDDE